ncbi:MAG: hypothetical protein VX672_02635 [Planctomycetota bacterium]|nr:hypothetical protein [Planctomycetota bacterium]
MSRQNTTLRTRRNGLRAAALLAAATTVGLDTTARGDIVFANYTDEDTFAYIVQDMPDFDQIRSDLPGGGRCYCGPAATSDLLGYVATHGHHDVAPGIPFVSWHTSSSYRDISNLMTFIGLSTGTGPGPVADDIPCGVGTDALYQELVLRLGDRFTVRNSHRDPSRHYAPDTATIARRGTRDQAVGIALWGRWSGRFVDEIWMAETRRGGHFEAITRANAGGGVRKLGLRDPADDWVDTTQSTFATNWYDVTRRLAFMDGFLITLDQLNGVYTVGVDEDGDGTADFDEDRMRFLEGYLSISPKAGYTWDETTHSVVRLVPDSAIWSSVGVDRESMTMPGIPSRVAFGPSDLAIASIIDGKVVKSTRHSTPRNTHRTIELPGGPWPDAVDLAFDPQRRLHVVAGDRVATIDWDRGEFTHEFRLPGEGTSLAIENGIVHVLVPEMEMVVAIDRGPDGPLAVELPLPSDALVHADSTITMLPGGRLLLLTDGRVNPMQLTDTGFMRLWVPVPRDGDWELIAADDNDMLCLVDRNGDVEAYRFTPNGFERNADHPMEGIRTSRGLFGVAASTSNLTPELAAQAWIGSEDDFDDRAVEIDCPGDLNFDGRVDSADMGLLLGLWGEDDPLGDLDRTGIVDSADLGLLLSRFGQCP